MPTVNETFLLSLGIIGLGYALKRGRVFTEEGGKFLAKLIVTLTLPAVIFVNVSTVDLKVDLILMPILAIAYSIVAVALAAVLTQKRSRHERGIILMAAASFNVGNFAFPLIEGIWGAEGLQYAAMFDVGNGLFIFIGCYLISILFAGGDGSNERKTKEDPETSVSEGLENPGRGQVKLKPIVKKIAKSIPIWVYFIALAVNLTQARVPVLLLQFLGILAQANMGIVLLCLGILLDFSFDRAHWGTILRVLAIRYGMGLLTGIVLYLFLPFDHFVRLIVFIMFILPIGMALIPFAVENGQDSRLIATMCNLTIVISFVGMWIAVLVLGA